MKKILFGLVTLIGLCCSFSSAGSVTYTGSFNNEFGNSGRGFFILPVPYSSYGGNNYTLNCNFSNYSADSNPTSIQVRAYTMYVGGSYGQTTNRTIISDISSYVINNSGFIYNMTDWNNSYYPPYSYAVWSNSNFENMSFDWSCTFFGDSIISVGGSCDYSDYVLESDITQSYCTNKFSNLIPESDITQNYCELEFGLIDPENCPSSGGTGDVLWSSFWVNDRQIEGASNIYLYMPDFLSWDYTYLNSGATLQIDVENEGDEDYINSIITTQTYIPTSDEFTVSFFGFLTLIMPYIIITLFIVFIWGFIKRIFK